MAKIKKRRDDKGERSFVIWMTVVGIVLVVSYAGFIGWRSRPKSTHPPFDKGGAKVIEEVEDPVCGMKVKPPAVGHIEYRAKHYYFCSMACKDDFDKDPEKYLHPKDTDGPKKMDMKEK